MTEKIEQACYEAKEKLIALGIEEQLVSELEWCLGSFASDKNPVGLYVKGTDALKALSTYREKFPRKVAKKIIDDLEKTLKN
jgi:hypothetical protein